MQSNFIIASKLPYEKEPFGSLFSLMILGQIIAVSLDEFVAHLDDIVDGEGRGCEGIEHCRLIDGVSLEGNSRLDGEKLNVYIGHIHYRALCGAHTRRE